MLKNSCTFCKSHQYCGNSKIKLILALSTNTFLDISHTLIHHKTRNLVLRYSSHLRSSVTITLSTENVQMLLKTDHSRRASVALLLALEHAVNLSEICQDRERTLWVSSLRTWPERWWTHHCIMKGLLLDNHYQGSYTQLQCQLVLNCYNNNHILALEKIEQVYSYLLH